MKIILALLIIIALIFTNQQKTTGVSKNTGTTEVADLYKVKLPDGSYPPAICNTISPNCYGMMNSVLLLLITISIY